MQIEETDFGTMVAVAYESLPQRFRSACDGLAIRVEPYASRGVMAAIGVSDPLELLGLYQGISLAEKSSFDIVMEPDMVLIYREPILAYAAAMDQSVQDVVTNVLVHEIGHHLGFSDEDMDAIENGTGAQ